MSEVPPDLPGSDEHSQQMDEGRGLCFPCRGCGSDINFSIDAGRLKCPSCGLERDISGDADAIPDERDFLSELERQRDRRSQDSDASASLPSSDVRCEGCGAEVVFGENQTSLDCPYCASAMQREGVHRFSDRIVVDGVLPFTLPRARVGAILKKWVSSRWFAPNVFKKRGVHGKFDGVYLPFWTFDSLTDNWYVGKRGEHYWVTVGHGDNKRRERRTRWYPASGSFRRFFDDVLVAATERVKKRHLDRLDPWPLAEMTPFAPELLSGFLAETYSIGLGDGFETGRSIMDSAIRAEVHRRIGGDEQRITQLTTDHRAITYKHILLPVWLMAYRFKEKPYQVVINARTGEIQGGRPYSFWKIFFAVVAGGSLIAGIVYLANT